MVVVGLVFFLFVALTGARVRLVESLVAAGPRVKRWGGVLLWGVGLWMLLLAGFADLFAGVFPV